MMHTKILPILLLFFDVLLFFYNQDLLVVLVLSLSNIFNKSTSTVIGSCSSLSFTKFVKIDQLGHSEQACKLRVDKLTYFKKSTSHTWYALCTGNARFPRPVITVHIVLCSECGLVSAYTVSVIRCSVHFPPGYLRT